MQLGDLHLCLSSETELRAAGVENDVLALQEDVAEDGEANAGVALDTTEAGVAGQGSVVNQ